jgi:DNA-binding NarL/FixJ family response regulator
VVDRAAPIRQLVMHASGSSARCAPLWFEASELRAAVQLLASFDFDIVIVDPRTVDGHIEAFTVFAGCPKRPSPYVVVISEEDDPQRIQDMLSSGVECHLSKRLPAAVLQDEMSRVMRELFDQPNGTT